MLVADRPAAILRRARTRPCEARDRVRCIGRDPDERDLVLPVVAEVVRVHERQHGAERRPALVGGEDLVLCARDREADPARSEVVQVVVLPAKRDLQRLVHDAERDARGHGATVARSSSRSRDVDLDDVEEVKKRSAHATGLLQPGARDHARARTLERRRRLTCVQRAPMLSS